MVTAIVWKTTEKQKFDHSLKRSKGILCGNFDLKRSTWKPEKLLRASLTLKVIQTLIPGFSVAFGSTGCSGSGGGLSKMHFPAFLGPELVNREGLLRR